MKTVLAFILGVLLEAAWGVFAADTTYMVKVIRVDHAAQQLEAKFIVMPEDLRLVCHGEAKKVFAGDYVKVEFKGGKTMIADADCDQIMWLR
jgi:hypothetical protein